jgi:hypothetical protein
MKVRSFLYMLLFTLPLMSAECFKTKDSPTAPAHETKITVKLSGEYFDKEAVDVSFDGGGTTRISGGETAYSSVEAGTHTILGTATVLKGTWAHTTEIKEGESKTINIPCDRATLIVKPDILWAGTVNKFEVIVTGKLGEYQFFVGPGLEGSTSFRPEAGMRVAVYKEKYGGPVADLFTHDFFYQDKLTLTIPFK